MSIFKEGANRIKIFWQSKTILFAISRIVLLVVLSVLVINFGTILTGTMPEGFLLVLARYLPQRCQEVRHMSYPPVTTCYTVFDKIYWSIPKWSSVGAVGEMPLVH